MIVACFTSYILTKEKWRICCLYLISLDMHTFAHCLTKLPSRRILTRMDVREIQSINLASIIKESGSASASGIIHDEILAGKDKLLLQDEAHWSVTVSNAGDDFWLSGEVHGQVLMECRRCLKPTPQKIDAHFQHLLEYHPEIEKLTMTDNEDGEETYHFGDPNLDLSFFIAQAFALAMPLTALCNESCRGLCPVCGADLNTTNCGHAAQANIPGTLADLGKFLDEV